MLWTAGVCLNEEPVHFPANLHPSKTLLDRGASALEAFSAAAMDRQVQTGTPLGLQVVALNLLLRLLAAEERKRIVPCEISLQPCSKPLCWVCRAVHPQTTHRDPEHCPSCGWSR